MKIPIAFVHFLVFLLLSSSSLFAQDKDPFKDSTDNPLAAKAAETVKPEKVVVHLPTLDLAIDWMESNSGLAFNQAEIYQLSRALKKLHEQPEPDKPRIKKLEEHRQLLLSQFEKGKQKLQQIPLQTTFDLERWNQFHARLKATRSQITETQIENRMMVDSMKEQYESFKQERDSLVQKIVLLKDENYSLTQEIELLRAEIERLKKIK